MIAPINFTDTEYRLFYKTRTNRKCYVSLIFINKIDKKCSRWIASIADLSFLKEDGVIRSESFWRNFIRRLKGLAVYEFSLELADETLDSQVAKILKSNHKTLDSPFHSIGDKVLEKFLVAFKCAVGIELLDQLDDEKATVKDWIKLTVKDFEK